MSYVIDYTEYFHGYYSMKRKKLKKSEYMDLAECISSDQVPSEDIVEYFKDKKFKKFYENIYINPYARPEETGSGVQGEGN